MSPEDEAIAAAFEESLRPKPPSVTQNRIMEVMEAYAKMAKAQAEDDAQAAKEAASQYNIAAARSAIRSQQVVDTKMLLDLVPVFPPSYRR